VDGTRAWFELFNAGDQRRDIEQVRTLASPTLIDVQDQWG